MDLSGLNREQRIAAETLEGPVLILAGAGSGKTRTLTYRIANLIEHGIKPWQILAITFTNKAAKEMQNRVMQLVSEEADEIWVSTFHSMCARILRRDIDKLGYTSGFTIYDDDDQMNVIKTLFKQLSVNEKTVQPKEVRMRIGQAKNALQSPREWFDGSANDQKARAIYLVYDAYEKKLKQSNALDFDDLLIKTLELFTNHPPVLASYQQRFRYVHVDEYQDTNYAQYMLVKMITQSSHSLCVVGDDDQSIYGWRGADVQNILSFKKDYPEAMVIKLEQNYRSTSTILDAANQVIAHNAGRMEKKLWTDNGDGSPIELYTAADERQEALWICEKLMHLQSEGFSMGDAAVLYRSNAQSRAIEEGFVRAKIPYQIFGAMRFYERKEIKDILAYLRCIANPSDDVSLRRIINVPKRSIGDTTVEELTRFAQANQMPLYSTLVDIPEQIGSRARKSVASFADILNELVFIHSDMRLSEFVQAVLQKTGLENMYRADETEEGKARLENIDELLSAVSDFEKNHDNATLESYLENISLVTDMDRADLRMKSVAMMTVHSAKGLEFPIVFLSGMEETLFPHIRSLADPEALEEERRLCYVAITRAQKRLFISNARIRMLRNQLTYNPPSRFIAEIPKRLLQTGYNAFDTARRTSNVQGKATLGAGHSALGISGLQKGFASLSGQSAHMASAANFEIGERVMHRKFGFGKVISMSGSKENQKICIDFDNHGEKEFLLSIAPIMKAGE